MGKAVLTTFLIVLSSITLLNAPLAADFHQHKKKYRHFGPWNAGSRRDVFRQNTKARSQAQFPQFGKLDKIPGEKVPAPFREDPDHLEIDLKKSNRVGSSLSSNPLYLASLFYRHILTKVDGPKCAHYPTCSRFANQAVAKHGVLGILMGLERVIRPHDSSSIRTLPMITGWENPRYLDPINNYEFWKGENFTGFPQKVAEKDVSFLSAAPTKNSNLTKKTLKKQPKK